ncbi:hypothetical protein BGW38_006111, partial [Lunasporangiospora selenospora]
MTVSLLSNTRVLRASYANKTSVSTSNFRVDTVSDVDLASVKEGEVILRNLYLSLDPYVRFTLDSYENGTPASFKILDVPFQGLGIAEVVASQ